MNTEWKKAEALLPSYPSYTYDFDALSSAILGIYGEKMKSTPQNPEWHGEGDVLTHTKMVCDALVSDPEFRSLSELSQKTVFVAALLHDIGKTVTTVIEDGVYKSPKHTSTGAEMARELLWTKFGFSGKSEDISFRESVSMLIRYHGLPMHIEEREDPERTLIRMVSIGEHARNFSLRLLCILVRADIKGRIADDTAELLEKPELCFMLGEELGIADKPYEFPDTVTKHAYLAGRNIPRDYPLYDDTWQEVILLSGLPGVGKDTWIRENHPSLPVISLDDIRRSMKISPADKEGQGIVISRAKELAREYLRERKPFVWNATNVTRQLRSLQLELFEKYKAYTKVIYLEAELETELSRNKNRVHTVPEDIIFKLIGKTEPPYAEEAHEVIWITT